MGKEKILAGRSTFLRKNNSNQLIISLNNKYYKNIFLINGTSFITEEIKDSDLIIKPNDYYMIFNKNNNVIEIKYNRDISDHLIIYNPYQYESSEKTNLTPVIFRKIYEIPKNYIDTLPKWYSFKFTYNDYNLIFVRPEFGISIQIHKYRSEFWEILEGKPIIIIGNKVHYFVENGAKFHIPVRIYHSVINPNKKKNSFVVLRERWDGIFDENDIKRVFNPNNYS